MLNLRLGAEAAWMGDMKKKAVFLLSLSHSTNLLFHIYAHKPFNKIVYSKINAQCM